MAITQDDVTKLNDEYANAYSEPDANKPEMSEDEAFGLVPDTQESAELTEKVSDKGDDDAQAVTLAIPIPADEAVEGMAEGAMAEAHDATESGEQRKDEPLSPEDVQREKSWRGRLSALEAELKARKAELDEREAGFKRGHDDTEGGDMDETHDKMHGEGAAEVIDAVQDAVESVQSGEVSAETAMAQLAEDFGADFAALIGKLIDSRASEIAARVTGEKLGTVSKSVDDIISGLNSAAARDHFEAIADAHPDFNTLPGSPLLEAYLSSLDEAACAEARKAIEGGSARQVIKLLTAAKAHDANKSRGQKDDPAMDAAEGVRSTGMKLPEKPATSSEYESAWGAF